MKAFIKFIKRTTLFLAASIVLIGGGMYYSDRPQDYMALSCDVHKREGNPLFMIRKKPFNENVEGLYTRPSLNPNFSMNDKITDLHKAGHENKTNKDWIIFKARDSDKLYFRLGRKSLDIVIGTFHMKSYSPNPDRPIRIAKNLNCSEISIDQFYDKVKPGFEKERAKFKI